jgi:hypothetical protein
MSAQKQLCLNLLQANSEEEVINILKTTSYWDSPNDWRLFGDRENNFSTIGNQQSRPEAALTEKVVNAIDARLMCECMKRGIDPTSAAAPGSITDAVAQFISGKAAGASSGGSVQEWTNTQRREESKGITIAVTGSKKRPCVTISDAGEGQSPRMMPHTFLSIDKSNKLRIPFVQGKFNMGGTGVLQFCGRSNLQLIVSRRNPAIVKAIAENDDTAELWAFTVVRRETGKGGVKNSIYTYLAPVGAETTPRCGEVLRFSADSLCLMPDGNNPYARDISSGSAIKLYEFDMKGFSSHALRRDGLLSRLEAMLPEPALPIRVHECRDYGGHAGSFETTLVGLSVRLDDNRAENIEEGFPDSIPFKVEGESMTARIYAFKADRAETYRTNEGIIFTINGQTHGAIPKTIFSRSKVKMGRLADSLLVTIDCTEISVRAREDLFMNSRDRLRNTELRKALEDQLEDILKQHPGLRELRERRQREEIEKRLEQSRPLEEVLEKLLKASPSLSRLFQSGNRILKPFKKGPTKGKDGDMDDGQKGDKPFEGKPHPTYFKFPKKSYGEILYRGSEVGRRCRISFETDVVNDYFKRSEYPGRFHMEVLEPTGIDEPNWSLTPHDGIASLSLVMPEDFVIGDKMTLQFTVEDDVLSEPFVNVATLTATPQSERPSGSEKQRDGTGSGGDSSGPSGIALPNIIEVEEKEWDKYKFDRYTACDIVQDADDENEDDAIYTFRINVDNLHLQTEIKAGVEDPRLPRTKFVFGNVLVGLALIQYFKEREKSRAGDDANGNGNGQSKLPEELTVEVFVREATRAMAPFILPMINRLGALSEDEVAALGVVGDDE